MYLYAFGRFAGHDRVFVAPPLAGAKAGDLFRIGEEYVLILGECVVFSESYEKVFPLSGEVSLVIKRFFDSSYLDLFHWMVEEYYTLYKNVMKYLLPYDDILDLLAKMPSGKPKKISQKLVVFPDLWSLMNTVSEGERTQKNTLVLYPQQTSVQKIRAWWAIKYGHIENIYTTYGELFQPFLHVDHIVLNDPHTWWYAHQQDPRYKVGDVLQKIAFLYGSSYEEKGV